MTKGRKASLVGALTALENAGLVTSWYVCAPGDRGRVWVIATPNGERVLTTADAERFVTDTLAKVAPEAVTL